MSAERERVSRLLSYVLRHRPDAFGLQLDAQGWVETGPLLDALARHGTSLTRDELLAIVRTSDKQRFALSADGARIRANQGHSVAVELGHAPAQPPELLYHGTVERFLASIRAQGLHRRSRQHVHLSPDAETAVAVGTRRGRAVVLTVLASAMAGAGHVFFRADNGVWLTERVPPEFLRFP